MVTIRLLGEAGRRFGRVFRLAVGSAAEAIRALCVQLPELRLFLVNSAENGIAWRVVTEDAMGLSEDELDWPCSKRVVLAPQPTGRGAVGRIIAGVAIIALTFGIGAIVSAGVALGGLAGIGTVGTAFVGIGFSLVLGGVAQLLTPTPRMPGADFGSTTQADRSDQLKSALFDKSNANTAQGDVVPVLYGERLIGSLAVLSFGVEIQNSI
jgi:predicted phage tail protein